MLVGSELTSTVFEPPPTDTLPPAVESCAPAVVASRPTILRAKRDVTFIDKLLAIASANPDASCD
jgi:hypothetical protein